MAVFTDEEFERLVYELTERKPRSYDALYIATEKFLRPVVKRWCYYTDILKYTGSEEDIMQEIHCKLIQTSVTGFFKRQGPEGPTNKDPDGFCRWMYKVALNIKRDFIRDIVKHSVAPVDIDDDSVIEPSKEDPKLVEIHEEVDSCFSKAITENKRVYIKLTWMMLSLLMGCGGFTKIEATVLIDEKMKNKKVFEIWLWVRKNMKKIPWLTLTEKHEELLLSELNESSESGRKIGDMKYHEFYMKKGGRATISDWANRMNKAIRGR